MPTPNEQVFDHEPSLVRCWLDRAREAVLTQADFSPLFRAYLDYARRWQTAPDAEHLPLIERCLAAATLHLAALPPDEFVAWTLNLHEPARNVFVAGDNKTFSVTGRAYDEHVRTAGHPRLYFESQRPNRKPQSSVLDVKGREALGIFEQFFLRSVQIPTRLFALGQNRFAFVQGLPRVDKGWLESLDPEAVEAWMVSGELEEVEQRAYRFACSCDLETILKVVVGLFRGKPDELFTGDDRVEVSCPRCGRRWWISRDEFDQGRLGSA